MSKGRHDVAGAYVEIGSTRQSTRTTYTRLLDLGPLSLLELLVGGLMLILTSINVLVQPDDERPFPANFIHYRPINDGASRFNVGHTWSIQIWLAIVGAGLGLVSHGLSEARVHLFDWWCSRQAQGRSGLDYARYLNTQTRSPVTYGVRGFWAFASLRYFVVCATIASSVGYKFGIVELTSPWSETVATDLLEAKLRNATIPYGGEAVAIVSPWFMGSAQCFTYKYQALEAEEGTVEGMQVDPDAYFDFNDDYDKAPINVILAGELGTNGYWTNRDAVRGFLTTREMVAVAELTEEEGEEDEEGTNLTMSADQGDWFRIETLGTNWINNTDESVFVEYRVPEPGKVQIQWAPKGPWFTEEGANNTEVANRTRRVTKRVTYDMYYATAEMERTFFDSTATGSLMYEKAAILLGKEKGRFPASSGSGKDNDFLNRVRNWIDAQVASEETPIAHGVSAILRGIMYGWALDDLRAAGAPFDSGYFVTQWTADESNGSNQPRDDHEGEYVRVLAKGEYPFGEDDEDDSLSRRGRFFQDLDYPFFNGYRDKGLTGCFPSAAGAFLAAGLLAWIVLGVRIWVGPAVLTSWTGQHVYLAQIGVISGLEQQQELASGYTVAPPQLGTLHLRWEKTDWDMELPERTLSKNTQDGQ